MEKNPITHAWDTATIDQRTEFIYDLDFCYRTDKKIGTGLQRIFMKYMILVERIKNEGKQQ